MKAEELIALRRQLHQHPELSDREEQTSLLITRVVTEMGPDEVLELGHTARAFVFRGAEEGPVAVFRAELDGLPIPEESDLEYRSKHEGISHACGHDGHMTMLAGLGARIAGSRPSRGKAVLLFQHAEENGQGAEEVCRSAAFRQLDPDYIFALHNIPGAPMHRVIVREGPFAAASRGMSVHLKGKSSHAGEPEQGINPAMALSRLISGASELNGRRDLFSRTAFQTVIHVRLGERAFGTSPGEAEIHFTLRSFDNGDMEILCREMEELVGLISRAEKLDAQFSYSEVFPATVNDPECTGMIRNAATELKLDVESPREPFRWSEDFGYFTGPYRGGYFGLGSGTGQPALHNPDYDFPDELLGTGTGMFYSIYKEIFL